MSIAFALRRWDPNQPVAWSIRKYGCLCGDGGLCKWMVLPADAGGVTANGWSAEITFGLWTGNVV